MGKFTTVDGPVERVGSIPTARIASADIPAGCGLSEFTRITAVQGYADHGAKMVARVVDVDVEGIYVGLVPLAGGGVIDEYPARSGIQCGWIQSDAFVVLQGGMRTGRGEQYVGPRRHLGGRLLRENTIGLWRSRIYGAVYRAVHRSRIAAPMSPSGGHDYWRGAYPQRVAESGGAFAEPRGEPTAVGGGAEKAPRTCRSAARMEMWPEGGRR